MYVNDFSNLSPEEKKAKRHALEMEIIILESDGKRFLAEENSLEAEIRKLGVDAERLRITLDEKKKRFEKLKRELFQKEDEVKRLKKKINLLT